LLKSFIETTRYLTTTKVTVNLLNWFVRCVESALDKGNGEIIVTIKHGRIYKKCFTCIEYEDEEDIDKNNL